mmetsp:Transcript_2140/g.6187  ORF Transcript_2140/g.6187 Transcript_2140/m.6187 type:complete len:248 (+) Transcript_2140:257-1000(+)
MANRSHVQAELMTSARHWFQLHASIFCNRLRFCLALFTPRIHRHAETGRYSPLRPSCSEAALDEWLQMLLRRHIPIPHDIACPTIVIPALIRNLANGKLNHSLVIANVTCHQRHIRLVGTSVLKGHLPASLAVRRQCHGDDARRVVIQSMTWPGHVRLLALFWLFLSSLLFPLGGGGRRKSIRMIGTNHCHSTPTLLGISQPFVGSGCQTVGLVRPDARQREQSRWFVQEQQVGCAWRCCLRRACIV